MFKWERKRERGGKGGFKSSKIDPQYIKGCQFFLFHCLRYFRLLMPGGGMYWGHVLGACTYLGHVLFGEGSVSHALSLPMLFICAIFYDSVFPSLSVVTAYIWGEGPTQLLSSSCMVIFTITVLFRECTHVVLYYIDYGQRSILGLHGSTESSSCIKIISFVGRFFQYWPS